MERDDCPNDPGFGLNHNFVFNTSRTVTDSFNITSGTLNYTSNNGAEFTINKRYDSPTIQSYFYIFWGSVSIIMKAATGQGVISSIVLQSECLDEVDWEFMGGNSTHAQTNYFGKGNQTTFDRAVYYPVDTDVRENFHNYTINWTKEKLDWYIDGVIVRSLPFNGANGGKNYPQTPMTVRLGVWAGGDPDNSNGTIEWAGGLTDFTKGPYTMAVQSAHVQDYSTGSEYEWTDRSGSWQSIKSIAGNSTVAKKIEKAENEEPSLSVSEKFAKLPQGTKLAIYGGGGAAGALLLSALLFFCIRQRRAGRKERDAYNAAIEKQRDDAYRDQMELREKGLGGWDNGAYAKQGEDALGGWGGSHVNGAATPPVPKLPSNVMTTEVPSRANSPAISRSMSPAIPRVMSPSIIAPIPTSPRQWNGGNSGGMIQNAGNAYSGGYQGNYGANTNIPRSPSFPLSPNVPQQRGYPGGYSQGGYQRF